MATYNPQSLGINASTTGGTFQQGAWYGGRQYWNGTLSEVNQIHPESNQQGAGQAVSQEVRQQSASAQGVSLHDFDQYLTGQLNAAGISGPTGAYIPYTSSNNEGMMRGLQSELDAARKALQDRLATERSDAQKKAEEARAREEGALSEIDKLSVPFREDLERSERERLGTEEVLSSQRDLIGRMEGLLMEGQELIKMQKEKTGLASIRNPRINKTIEDVTAQAGVLQAVLASQTTYLSNAYHTIDRSINSINDDRAQRISYYEKILSLANRDVLNFEAKDLEMAKEEIGILKGDMERAAETVNYVKSLMLNPDTALLMAQAGVSLNDSVEVIKSKLATAQYANEVKDMANEMGKQGYTVVIDPKSVPADQLVTLTDRNGNKTYYKKIREPSSGGSGFGSISDAISFVGFEAEGLGSKTKKSTQTNTIDINAIWNSVMSNNLPSNVGTPNFAPAGGVGTVFKNSSGTWKYTSSGWRLAN